MPKAPDPFHEFVAELFQPLGAVTIRRMFGGAGVYKDGVMFALLANDVIYLKADAALRKALMEEGCEPFIWIRPADKMRFDLGYVSLPSGAMDDADEASAWGRKALTVAKAAKAKAPVKKAATKSKVTKAAKAGTPSPAVRSSRAKPVSVRLRRGNQRRKTAGRSPPLD
jgi:DNA transformation protein